ncbi:unnamed protein product [Caenorhabditis angaria]|uniref:Uncharacterized protein n=1 Tax=Caenorhabditis angaria TaxID=860376 RepID=A0A9P1IMG6_9PELO|nr:unnamed protein product [Caenorhabditis angaria]
MCQKYDLSLKVCCASAKLLLLASGAGMIALGVIMLILGILAEHGHWLGVYYIWVGAATIVTVFYPAKWWIILNYIDQILLAILCVVCAIIGLTSHVKTLTIVFTVASVGGCVFSILACVVFQQLLCCNGGFGKSRGGSSSGSGSGSGGSGTMTTGTGTGTQ